MAYIPTSSADFLEIITLRTTFKTSIGNCTCVLKMHFIKVAALLPLAAFTKAWVIPEGTADGVYAVTRGADGKELHTRIASADSALEVRGTDNALGSNILVEIWCGM